jgi:hypothetical protein
LIIRRARGRGAISGRDHDHRLRHAEAGGSARSRRQPSQQATGVATALAETAIANLVTREYLDLRLGEIRATMATMATKAELAEAKAEILRWIIGAIGFQTIFILGAVAALIRLLH